MIKLDRHLLGALVRHLNLAPGALGAAFYDIPPDAAYIAQAGAWYNSAPPASKLDPSSIATLAAPALVADVRVFQGRDSLIRTFALAPFPAGPLVLAAQHSDTELTLKTVPTRDDYVDTLVTWLLAGGEPAEPELKVEMTQPEFAALLALFDLHSRAAYSAYISHRPTDSAYSQDHIIQAYDEAVSLRDPRWLLSFTLPLLDDEHATTQPAVIAQSLESLASRGLIARAGADWTFTLPGEFLAESFHRRQIAIAVDTAAADPQGQLGTHAGLILRSDSPLWYADIAGSGTVTLCGISLQTARDILDTLLTPLAPAPAFRAPAPPPLPPPPPPAAPAVAYCPHCGLQLPPGSSFCGGCGSRLA